MDKAAFLASIEADRDKHIEFLQALIQAPSPNPPGDTTQAAQVVLKYLAQHGIQGEVIEPQKGAPNIVCQSQGGQGEGPNVVMNGHLDVFPVDNPSGWALGPWSGHSDGEFIYGRGAVDMKAGTAASVVAYRYLHQYRQHRKGTATLVAVSDEETGGKWGSKYLLEHDARTRGDCMINGEPGGLGSIRFGEKGTLRLTFIIQTRGGHGAYTHAAEGANRMAMRLLSRLDGIQEIRPQLDAKLLHYIQHPETQAVIDGIMGPGAGSSMLHPTVNIGTIHGGLKVNMIPEHCVVEVDVRLPIGLHREQVLDHIDSILKEFPDVEVQVQEAASNPAAHCLPDHPLLKCIADNAENILGVRPRAIPSIGATDAKFWRYRGIPAYVYGVSPETMAATNERVKIQEYLAIIKTHAAAVWDYLSTKP